MSKKKTHVNQGFSARGAHRSRQTQRGTSQGGAEHNPLASTNLLVLAGRLTSPCTYHRSNEGEQYLFHLAHDQTQEADPLRITVCCSLPSLHRIACQLQPGDPIIVAGTLQYSQVAGQQPCFQMLAHEIHQHHVQVDIRRVEQ